jgi:uncharacterized iron-regulated membrane protein
MRRGFDDLMTPWGIFLVVGSALLLVFIIAVGAILWRHFERRGRSIDE